MRNPFKVDTFEAAVMAVYLLVGVALLVHPELAVRSPVGRNLHWWTPIWSTLYVIGCPTTALALAAGISRIRVAGLSLVGAGLLMQAVAALTYSALDPRAYTYLVFGVCCVYRAHVVATRLRVRARTTDRAHLRCVA